MLMKCKTCEEEFIPPIKNILRVLKLLFAKKKPEEENFEVASESEQNGDEYSERDEQNDDEEKQEI